MLYSRTQPFGEESNVPALQNANPQIQITLEIGEPTQPEELTESCRTFLESLGQPFHLSVFQPRAAGISVVIPILDEEATLSALYARLTDVLAGLEVPYELVMVDDGSTDRTPELLRQLRSGDPRVKYIRLARNFGHQAALTAGLAHATGQAVVVMDADLQDPPEVIPELVERWQEGYEVVYAIRRHRKEPPTQRLAYALFYRLLSRVASLNIPLDAGDYCLMDRRVVDQLNALPERNRFLRGLRSWVGYRQIGVEYERQARYAGHTKYDFWRLARLAVDGLVSFSFLPLRIASSIGFVISVVSMIVALYYLVLRLSGNQEPAGFAAVIVAVLFLGGVQLITIGIMGEYVGRIFDEVKSRPVYIVLEEEGFDRT
jgi:glycosyltransferase involved in cell wall biosynthesis